MKLLKPSMPCRAWLMVLLLLASATLANAAPSRPFKATIDLTVTGIGREEKCPGTTPGVPGGGEQLSGTGHAAHLGAVQVLANHCVNSVQQVNFYFFNGQMALTAANGDVVRADYSGFFTLVSPDVYSFEGNYFITGGTGRFQDAVGTGALFGTGSFLSFTLTAEGGISY
jgi:hypothetical protein